MIINKTKDIRPVEYYEEITARSDFSLNLKELWQYRELLLIFSLRDIKVKYKQTTLGVLWVILQPVIMVVIFTLTIGAIFPNIQNSTVPYPVFVYSGLIFWYLFANGVQNASNSMLSNENIIKKIYFPRLIIPFSSIVVALFDFTITFLLYVFILVLYEAEIDYMKFALYFPLALLINLLVIFGLGTFFAALNIKFRDFRYMIPFMLQFLMFVCPVFYPSAIIKMAWVKYIFMFNPINAVLELSRGIFLGSQVNWISILLGTGIAMIFFIIGLVYFRKTESYFADIS